MIISDLNQTGYKGDNIMGSFQFGLEELTQQIRMII